MDDSAISELLQCLKEERPAVLFLGQNAWASSVRTDPILFSFLQRKGRSDEISLGWQALFSSNNSINDEDMQWLTERYARHVQSDEMQDLLDVPWSAVFTTSIDPQLTRRLETRGRQPEAVLARDYFARVPRSRNRTPVHYLFGRTSETVTEFRCPRSKYELRQRISTHCISMLNRIPETVTPIGLLIVEGFSSDDDWLQVDDFLAPLSVSNGLRILWFGSPNSPQSDFYAELVRRGSLVPCSKRLTEIMAEIHSKGLLEPIGSTISDEPGIISIDGDKFIDTSPSLRLRVEASAAIVDDTWTSLCSPIEGTALEEAFRRFHGDLGGLRDHVEGITRGFAIKRDFEQDLRDRVEGALKDQINLDRTVILHGQSGTGKSIALARLAHDFREELKVPVLYATGRVPNAADLDGFCIEAERAGAIGTLILCDANQNANRYKDLANALRSRGRRIAVVGTTYKTETTFFKDSSKFVEAPTDVSANERTALRRLIDVYGSKQSNFGIDVLDGDNVLALLYRILSAGRERIVAGISNEARAVEEVIRNRATSTPAITQFNSALADQLIEAGLHNGSISFFEEDKEGAALGTDTPGRLIDYVMAAGRLNCPIPVNLLIRALNDEHGGIDLTQISHLFYDLDLFRWHAADIEGNDLLISPRLQLEAELICRRRLADKNQELGCLINLIEAVRPSGVDRSSEVRFLLDLLHNLERSGPRGDIYSNGYLKIAQSLTKLRVHYNVEDASLMLQESAFRRSALLKQNRIGDESNRISEEQQYEILNEAREVVETAIRKISGGQLRAGRRTKENLQVERASIYGYLAVGRARAHATQDIVWSDYLAARTAITHAMSMVDNYFPLDIGLWTPIDIIEEKIFSKDPIKEAEIRADIYSVLDQVDIDQLSLNQQEKHHERKVKIANALGDEQLSDDAYKRLEEINPAVALFLKARYIGAEIFKESDGHLSNELRKKARVAADFLNNHFALISSDIRCLNLMLQFSWAAITGFRLLRGERRPVPFDKDQVRELRTIVCALNQSAGTDSRYVYRYLEATLEWLSNNTQRAQDLWSNLAHETEFEDPSRIIRRLYIADIEGKPAMFRGRVERQRGDKHWLLRVEGVQGLVDLTDRDFKTEDLTVGRELRDFAISFNYLGPIADPASRFGGRS